MGEPIALPAGGTRLLPVRLLGDEALARLAADGDDRAFSEIYQRYHQELYRYCRALLGNTHDAQDALQGVMANALRALPGETRRIALKPWLYRVAHNEAMSVLRRKRQAADQVEMAELADGAAEQRPLVRERLRQLLADLRSLPQRQRGALTMRELSGMDYAEIAAALDVSEGAARQAVYEARTALHELSEGRDMECDAVREALSDHDRRRLRGRRMRAHLRSCTGCTDFLTGIERRRADLAALAPPLPAVAASQLIPGLIGGTAGTGGAAGMGAGGALLATGAGKVATGLVLAASVATGVGGYVEISNSSPATQSEAPAARGAAAQGAGHGAVGERASSRHSGGPAAGQSGTGSGARDGGASGGKRGEGSVTGPMEPVAPGATPGASGSAPGAHTPPVSPSPGQGQGQGSPAPGPRSVNASPVASGTDTPPGASIAAEQTSKAPPVSAVGAQRGDLAE
jgi:RNA polymerase sigma factor (sigma-70 family)